MIRTGGPMFEPAITHERSSLFGKEGGHYNIYRAVGDTGGLAMLKSWFPTGEEVDEMNIVLFSTSGVHGSYVTIEDVEASLRKYPDVDPEDDDTENLKDYCGNQVTFLLVQPRLVAMTFGNAVVTLDDIPYLKKLRAASWAAVQKIGAPE